jgi:hypothetical protein
VGANHQLLGTEVILLHRLLKNSVTAEMGIRAYVLCTEAAAAALGVQPAVEGMVAHREAIPDLGEIDVWVKDMHPVYESRRGEDQVTYSEEDVLVAVAADIPMSAELVWDYLNQSELRNVLIESDSYNVLDRQGGKIGPGSTYQCYHGKMIVRQVVIEWRPFERVLLSQRLPFKGQPTNVLIDLRLTPTESGTRLTETAARVTGPFLKRILARGFLRRQRQRSQRAIDNFADQIQRDLALRETG